MFAINSILLLIVISLCHSQSTTDRQCLPDTIDFATKVEKSPVVVYGKAMAKTMYEGSNSTFHVFFQVDCILKGPATLRQINITNAGRVNGKQYCQQLPVGHGYSIVFLEPISSNITDFKTFTPADFAEIPEEGNSISELLARTCTLHRLVPQQSLATVSQVCPAVGTDSICQQVVNTTPVMATNIIEAQSILSANGTTIIVSNKTIITSDTDGRLTHPINSVQQEIEKIRGKSGASLVDVDKHNGAKSTTFSVILIIMAIFFCTN